VKAAIPKKAFRREVLEVSRFLMAHADHEGIKAALYYWESLLDVKATNRHAELDPMAWELRRLHLAGVTPSTVLGELGGLVLYLERNPIIPQADGGRARTFAFARCLAQCAKRGTALVSKAVQTGRGMEELGRLVQPVLPLLYRVAETIR